MATDSAVLPNRRLQSHPTRHIWQVPLFLSAAALFAATWFGWIPVGPPPVGTVLAQKTADLNTAYERVAPDRDELKGLLIWVAAHIDSAADPRQLQSIHFALGSGYSRLAEFTPASEEARGYWSLAQQHLNLVDPETLTDSLEKAKLRFRKAKAQAAVELASGGSDKEFRDLITQLAPNQFPLGEDGGDAARLQAELAMRVKPPEAATAKEALSRYVVMLATPTLSRYRAMLQLSELHYNSKEFPDALKWLEYIGADAPGDLLTAKKTLLGRVYMGEENWANAMREWETLRAMPNLAPALRTTTAYNLGVCKIRRHENDEAIKLFEEALKGQDSPETAAAAVRLAHLDLKSNDPARRLASAELFERGMRDVSNLKDLRKNPNITATEVFETFELGLKMLVNDGSYEAALKVVAAYKPIAEVGQDVEKRAEILSAWAHALQKANSEYKSKANDSAKEYLAFAELQQAASVKADSLRKAADMYRLAGNPNEAVSTLQEASKLKDLPEAVAGPVWVDLADALLAAKRPDEVWQAFNEAMKVATPISTATRYNLAHDFAKSRQPETTQLARWLFEQIARQPDISQAEQEFQERSLVELADLLIRIYDYTAAEQWLRQQLHAYPTGNQAPLGRLLRGICLLQLAQIKEPAGPTPAKAMELREEALKLFSAVVAEMDAKAKKVGKLTESESWLRVQAAIRVLQSYLLMKKLDPLFTESLEFSDRYRGTVEELIMLNLVYHAFRQKYEEAKLKGLPKEQISNYQVSMYRTHDRMKEVFDQLPMSAFTGTTLEYTREYWEKVWFTPEKK